jgi:hypothetical protein
LILTITAVFIAIIMITTIYLSTTLFLDKSDNSLAKQENHAIKSMAKIAVDIAPASLEKPPHTAIQKEVNSFEQFLASMPTHDQDKYIKLNEYFFGVLAFSRAKEYSILKEQGFPSLKEINYVMEYRRRDLNTLLWNNLTQEELDEKELSLNLNAIKTVNLVETIEELTQVINYYFPEYEQATPIPALHKWPNGKHPEQAIEALGQLIQANALVRETNAMGLLAKARYMQLLYDDEISYRHTSSILKTLAMANKKLQGNDNILNYVKEHYPEELDTYIDLTNNL